MFTCVVMGADQKQCIVSVNLQDGESGVLQINPILMLFSGYCTVQEVPEVGD